MWNPLLAVRTSWIGLLAFLFALFALWFAGRALIDLIIWFKEEIVDDWRDGRQRRNDRSNKKR